MTAKNFRKIKKLTIGKLLSPFVTKGRQTGGGKKKRKGEKRKKEEGKRTQIGKMAKLDMWRPQDKK